MHSKRFDAGEQGCTRIRATQRKDNGRIPARMAKEYERAVVIGSTSERIYSYSSTTKVSAEYRCRQASRNDT